MVFLSFHKVVDKEVHDTFYRLQEVLVLKLMSQNYSHLMEQEQELAVVGVLIMLAKMH